MSSRVCQDLFLKKPIFFFWTAALADSLIIISCLSSTVKAFF
ncbi:hypothetical protein CLOSTMETH_01761, partial [[Clostridium] methylpentosum DSM 5476]